MKLGLYGRVLRKQNINFVQLLIDSLDSKECSYTIHESFLPIMNECGIKFKAEPKTFIYHPNFGDEMDYLLTLGGDGTLLDSLRIIRKQDVKVLGINMGRMGFLATVNKNEIQVALNCLEKNDYVLDERSLVEVNTDKPIFGDENFALNEFTIYKKDTSSMITVHTYVNGEFLNSYWADGVIVATPTGSTGYNLSCGGPVVEPKSENLVLTPIAPHNLNVRPIVLNDSVEILFDAEGRSDHFITTLDSRHTVIDSDAKVIVKKADFKLKLIRLPDSTFIKSLRSKLMWGVDTRN